MDVAIKFFENILLLANAMSIFILAGLLIAGVLKEIVPPDFVSRHLGEGKIGSVIKATLFGIPMPVCSCSIIPLAKALQKEGASKGAVQSFLISTPITGADSIMATYGFFGWIFTLYRVVTSVIIAITTGILQNSLDARESRQKGNPSKSIFSTASNSSIGENKLQNTSFGLSPMATNAKDNGCCSDDRCGMLTSSKKRGFSLYRVFYYAFVTLFKDIYFSLFIGIVLGAAFATFVPKELLEPLFEYRFVTYIAVLLIAMPLYVCATASLPIAAAFLLSGMSGGAAFVFLSAGPATSTVTMGVVGSMLGKRSLILYVSTIAIMSILFGYLFDQLFSDLELIRIESYAEQSGLTEYASSAIMFGLIFYYMLRRK